MASSKKEVRRKFRDQVFARDNEACKVCSMSVTMGAELDAHHITDRTLMEAGGYVPENGISLCKSCHVKAEKFHSTGKAAPGFHPDELYALIGSSHAEAIRASKRLSSILG